MTGRQFPQFTAVVNGHHERSPNNTNMLISGQAATRTHVSIGPYQKSGCSKELIGLTDLSVFLKENLLILLKIMFLHVLISLKTDYF